MDTWKKFTDEEPTIGAKILVYGNPYPMTCRENIYIAHVVHVLHIQLMMQFNYEKIDYIPFCRFSHWILLLEPPKEDNGHKNS